MTLDELRHDPKLTPATFARHFSSFKYARHDEVQPPEVFLETQSGDCDDYATLAACVLREKGFTTRLIAICLPGDTHVVCYVEETGSYLDYNTRGYVVKTVPSSGKIEEIARKVARSFDSRWISAIEFDYRDGLKWLVKTATPHGAAPLLAAMAIRH